MTQTFTIISVPNLWESQPQRPSPKRDKIMHATVDASKSDVIARPDTSPIGKDFCEG
jgi:hypothetical protein